MNTVNLNINIYNNNQIKFSNVKFCINNNEFVFLSLANFNMDYTLNFFKDTFALNFKQLNKLKENRCLSFENLGLAYIVENNIIEFYIIINQKHFYIFSLEYSRLNNENFILCFLKSNKRIYFKNFEDTLKYLNNDLNIFLDEDDIQTFTNNVLLSKFLD